MNSPFQSMDTVIQKALLIITVCGGKVVLIDWLGLCRPSLSVPPRSKLKVGTDP